MLRPSRKTLFAIEAVVDIAWHGSDSPVQSAEITQRQGIPRRYLEQVLQRLVRAGILTGVRGPRGGYRLGRERHRITVGEISRTIADVEAGDDDALPSSPLGEAVVRPLWQEIETDVLARLDGLSIEDLCGRARSAGLVRDPTRATDWVI